MIDPMTSAAALDDSATVAANRLPCPRQDASIVLDFKELTLLEHIGGGASSLVYRAYWLKTPVAAKKWFDPTCDAQTLREFTAEFLTTRDLRHPNIVQFLAACGQPPDLCIVLEYLPTSLYDLLHVKTTPLEDGRIVAMALDVARALLYLHTRTPAVIHRDVKTANLLLDRTWKVKLSDFGLAACGAEQRRAGTVAYMAPELLTDDGRYDASVDVYAFGIVLNEMVGRRRPFDGLSEQEIRKRTLRGERPEIPLSCDPKLRRLIDGCTRQASRDRPTIDVVVDELQSAAMR